MKTKLLDKSGKAKKDLDLPKCFGGKVRADILLKVFEAQKSAYAQAYGAMEGAGAQYSASGISKKKRHLKQNERFLSMTGITIQEKSFHNMINFNKHELLKILKSKDQHIAISKLPKNTRKTLENNGIITKVWRKSEITLKTLDYLFR